MKSLMDRVIRPALETVNFEQMNLIPDQEGFVEKRAEIVPGMVNVWYEYIPACYDGTKPVPLVVQVHGGGQDGRRWAAQTVWHKVAEKQNFIVIYPNSPTYGMWQCDETDIQYLLDLINLICTRYSIDRERIYMQGMSNGDMMTLAFTLKHPEILAAAGYISGPSSAEALDGDMPVGALPMVQMRGELDVNWQLTPETVDVYHNRYTMNDLNRAIWECVNGTEGVLPTVSIRGKDNFLYYEGKHAPIINWEIQAMGHREPAYSAQVLWDVLYSGARRTKEGCVVENIRKPVEDDGTVLLALGSGKAYCGNRMVQLSSLERAVVRMMLPAPVPHFCPIPLGEMCETEVMCAPVEIFQTVFGAQVEKSASGEVVTLTLKDGRRVILRSHSVLMEIDGEFAAMQKPCILLGATLYVPIAEMVEQLLGKRVSVADDVMCITDHYAVLGRYTARIICQLLGGKARPHVR